MIHAGTDLKYRVVATLDGFSMADDDFSVLIKNSWGRVVANIPKSEMAEDDDGGFIFMLPKMPEGKYRAVFTASRADDDYDDETQDVTDVQMLAVVSQCGCQQRPCCTTAGLTVTYTRVWMVNSKGGIYLTDCYGNYIVTSDGRRITFKPADNTSDKFMIDMTGEEFKSLLQSCQANQANESSQNTNNSTFGLAADEDVRKIVDEYGHKE